MAILAFALILVGLLALCIGSIWFVVNAFRVSVLWGIVVTLFSPAWIRFTWRHWDMAKAPFLITLAGLALSFGGAQMLPDSAPSPLAELTTPFGALKADQEEKKAPALPAMSAAQKEAELKLKLAALARKESDLRDRKSAMDPKNREAALALQQDIEKYNAELQPTLQEMREAQERGMLSATR